MYVCLCKKTSCSALLMYAGADDLHKDAECLDVFDHRNAHWWDDFTCWNKLTVLPDYLPLCLTVKLKVGVSVMSVIIPTAQQLQIGQSKFVYGCFQQTVLLFTNMLDEPWGSLFSTCMIIWLFVFLAPLDMFFINSAMFLLKNISSTLLHQNSFDAAGQWSSTTHPHIQGVSLRSNYLLSIRGF